MRMQDIRKEHNFRELGGYVTENGRIVRHGQFYRSGPLGKMSAEELAFIESLGICHIFDFRSDTEVRELPDPEIHGAVYHQINALTDSEGNPVDFSPKAIDQADFSDQKGKDFLEIMYGNLPFTKAYVDMFEAIKKKETPILFHCTAGKDRTGIAAVLILILLGVDEQTALDDYELTNDYRTAAIERFLKKMEAFIGENEELRHSLRGVEGVNRENAELSLQRIRDRYGDYETYFKARFGIDEKMQAELASYYTGEAR